MQNHYLIYKVRFGQQVVCAAYALIPFGLISFFMAGMFLQGTINFFEFILISLVLFGIPVFPIHFHYLKEDNGKIVKINYEEKIILIQQYNQKIKIRFEDIQYIVINANNTGRYNQWMNYKYATFQLKNNSYFIITRFIMNFDEELYTLVETKSKDCWYPTIKEEGEKLI